jgi:hypothetical protein
MKLNFYSALLFSGFLLSPISGNAQIAVQGKAPYFVIEGGPDGDLSPLVLEECKKTSPFAQTVKLTKDEKKFLQSRSRIYHCHLFDLDKDTVRPTSLQQKVMQTRKFDKPHDVVYEAIASWIKDLGGIDTGGDARVMTIEGTKRPLMVKNFKAYLNVMTHRGMTMSFELTPTSPSVTEVRLRTQYVNLGHYIDVFSPPQYQKIFNMIAQQMFIEAIEIDPQEVK